MSGTVTTATPAAAAAQQSSATPPGLHSRRILVLYVGGTIGMMKNAEGALDCVAGYLTQQMHEMRELRESNEIAPFDVIEYEQLLDSSDMNAADYRRIAADVVAHYDEYDGFLIAHGTDTMHYTASALSFMLNNLDKPVIVTGAMVPLAEPYNDARRNVVISMMIASDPKICEVCVFFNDSLFRGNRCSKAYHSYGAFISPNYPALGVMESTHFVLKEEYLLPQPNGAMKVMSDLRGRVGCYPLDPDADVDTIISLLEHKRPSQRAEEEGDSAQSPLLDAIVLTLNGVGSSSGTVARQLQRIVKAAQQHNIVVCAVTRELSGTLSAQEVQRLRAISPYIVYLYDMCISAAEVKLMYLFGKGLQPSQVAALMPENLRGEVTPPVLAGKL